MNEIELLSAKLDSIHEKLEEVEKNDL